MTRKCLIHLGAGKTGSTALQNMLYCNRETLRESGVNYTSNIMALGSLPLGNASELYWLLKKPSNSKKIMEWLKLFVIEDYVSIISSEMLASLELSELLTLLDCLIELETDSKILLYVRSPMDYYLSAYKQKVKAAACTDNLLDFVKNSSWEHLTTLQNLHLLRNKIDMNIVLYDEVSSQLSQSFFDNLFFLCGIAVTGQIQEEETIVNRSLSQSELNLLLKLNSSEATDISQRIGDFLVQEVIPDDTKVGVNSEVAELIAARHGDDISWVNRTFFDGRNAIQLELDNYPQTTLDKAKDYPDSETLLRVLLFTIDLNDRVSKEVEYFLEHHDYFDKMPDGRMFDNLYYFLNNKDVLLAGFNPLDHFTKYGEAEGRAFRTGRRE